MPRQDPNFYLNVQGRELSKTSSIADGIEYVSAFLENRDPVQKIAVPVTKSLITQTAKTTNTNIKTKSDITNTQKTITTKLNETVQTLDKSKLKKINLFSRSTTEQGSPIITTIDLSFWQTIEYAELAITLHANDTSIFGGFLPVDWRLTKATVNDKTFSPSDPLQSRQTIHDNNSGMRDTLRIGKNSISIYWNAPIGAGVISPSSVISADLFISGKELLPLSDLSGFTSENLTGGFNSFLDGIVKGAREASYTTIAILFLIVLGLFVIAYLFGGKIPKFKSD